MRRYRMLAHVACAASALLFGATVAAAAPAARTTATATVTAVTVVPGAGRADVVLSYDGAVTVSDFTLENPQRIVVDVKGATMRLRTPSYDRVNRAGIRNVRIGQYEADVVRLVLDLDAARDYHVVRGDGEIRVSVRGSDDFAPWSSGSMAVREMPIAPVTPVADASEPSWGSALVAPTVQQQEQRRLTITFSNQDIHDVIATFASVSGRTFVTGSSVEGRVRFTEIVNQPWDVALAKILQANGLQAVEDSTGIITIDSYRNLAARVAAEPLVTQLVVVNYAKASALAGTIRALIAACSSGSVGAETAFVDAATGESAAAPAGGQAQTTCGRGVVTHEEKTNTLLIT
jgi:type IV pilus assembly protein PilQ